MNILLISPYFSPAVGGVETHLDDLCKYFTEKKHKVFVRTYKALSTKNRGEINEKRGSVQIHRMNWPDYNLNFKLESYPLLRFLYVFTGLFFDCLFFMLSNHKKIDVIQVHGFIAVFMGVILAKLFGKRLVVNTHVGFKFDNQNLMNRFLVAALKGADQILVLTTGAKKSLSNIGIPDEKIKIYHYWVDQKVFNVQKNAKEKLNWEKKFVVLFVGRLIDVKGVNYIFDVAKSLPNVYFAIAGSGPLSDDLAEKSKSYKNVEFLGKVNNKDLPVYYNGADVLLIPSKIIKQEYEEGIPRVMIEALSCGTPIVSTKSGGIPDVFSPQIGYLVKDNPKSIAEALQNLITNKRQYLKIKAATRPFALKNFSVKNAEIIEASLK